MRPNFGVVLCIPPGVSALGHKDKCSVITHQVKQGNCWPKKHSLVQTLYIPKWTFAPAPHPRGLKRDFLRFSESRFQTNSVSTAREDRERPFSALAASEGERSKNPVSVACAGGGLSTASRQHQHVGTRISSGTEQCQR